LRERSSLLDGSLRERSSASVTALLMYRSLAPGLSIDSFHGAPRRWVSLA
jgi:hypothetical protein